MANQNGRQKTDAKKYILVLRSDLAQIARIESFLKRVNRLLRLDEVQFNKLFLAATEAVNNAIIHGNEQDPKKKVTVTCEVKKKSVTIRVRDEGEGYDIGRAPNPLAEENLLKENGRGIFLIRTLMDTVKSRMTDDGPEVVMKMNVKREKET